MNRTQYRLYRAAGTFGLLMLFAAVFCYVFAAIGLLSLGLVTFPSALLGHLGLLEVTSDIAPLPLLMITGGTLLLGGGMCLCIISVCRYAFGIYKRYSKTAAIKRKKVLENETQQDN